MLPSRFDSRTTAGAVASQGRASSAAAQRRTLDGTRSSAGYNQANRIRSTDFADIKRHVTLAMVLAHYGILDQLKRRGSQLCGCCPIHAGSNAKQFVAHLASNNWHCFGDCNRGGGTLEFVAQREQVPITRAAQLLVEWFALPSSPRPAWPQQQRKTRMNTRPSHRAYVVEDREADANTDQGGFWTKIGSAWPHKDGKGLNVVLSALPVNGKIVLREYTAEDEAADVKRVKRSK